EPVALPAGPLSIAGALLKRAGIVPLPGYRMVRLCGRGAARGGWEGAGPEGGRVAGKFLRVGDPEEAEQLKEAWFRLREIRHPGIVSVFWVEQLGDELAIAMELADQSLHDRQRECQLQGLPGIPRAELLAALAQVADALDYLHA